MGVQIFVALFDVWLVGMLGLESLAASAIVGPFIVVVMNVSSGAFGGAVAASIARALGGGRRDDAAALVIHALVVAAGLGALCTLFAWTVAPTLYRLLGAEGEVLKPIVRCAAIDVDPDSGVTEPGLTDALYRICGRPICGLYLTVTGKGDIALGDQIATA